jgi:hypothetical protein
MIVTRLNRELRTDSTLADEKGNAVNFEQGAPVEVTMEADAKDTEAKSG